MARQKRKKKSKSGNLGVLLLLMVLLIIGSLWAIELWSERRFTETSEQAAQEVQQWMKATGVLEVPDTSQATPAAPYPTRAGFARPASPYADGIYSGEGFVLAYAEDYEQARWVAYELNLTELKGTISRTDNFRADPRIASESAALSDYHHSGYDRGHLAPAADFSWSSKAMSESFYLSNMSPQEPSFNRGIWKKLETFVRDKVEQDSALWIVTGPVLDAGLPTIGTNEVAVPRLYYKVLLDLEGAEFKAIGFLMRNEASREPLTAFAVSADSVEALTGLDFWPLLHDDYETKLEAAVPGMEWFR